jgi:hypothetical protein
LYSCFFARRADFGGRVVGQAGSLRPIVNRPNVANVQHSSFAARRYAGQAGNLRPIVNRPTLGESDVPDERHCRYAPEPENSAVRRRLATGAQDDILPHETTFKKSFLKIYCH